MKALITVTIGRHGDAGRARKASVKAGRKISDWANDIMGKVKFARSQTSLNLVVVANAELGYRDGCTFAETCKAAKAEGLRLCPAEAGLALAEVYNNQPNGECLLVAMEPITDSGGAPVIFNVGRYGGELWLGTGYGSPGWFWRGDGGFVFVRP